MISRLIATCVLSLFGILLFAQKVEDDIIKAYNDYKYYNTYEFAYLKPDKRIFYSGESLKFNVAILNQYFSLSDLSGIIHIELIHESTNESTKFTLRLNSGKTDGLINIPIDIASGNYQMIAYSHFMRNHDINLLSDRVPIYIHNVLEEPGGKIVKDILGTTNADKPKDIGNNYKIEFEKRKEIISLEIHTPEKGDYYLVSEGLKSIQFIAKVKATNSITNFAIPTTPIKGGFQRFILLNAELKVVAIRAFYFNDYPAHLQKRYLDNKLELNIENNLVSKIALRDNDSPVKEDPLSLFKRLYRIYYNIPLYQSIDSMTFEELVADSTLRAFSDFSLSMWEDVANSVKRDSDIKFYPEKNIQLSGRVEGDPELMEEANIAVHLFENQLDITQKLNENGEFSIEFVLPTGQDYVKASILNNSAIDISEKVKIEFNEGDTFSYNSNVSFYSKELTDSIINSNSEFKYVLSTFSDLESGTKYFWDNLKFDETIKVSDYYRSLETFEDFIKEAVMNVSVAESQGDKIVRMYNATEGTFDKPQLIVLDNKVLQNTNMLFDIPLDSIEYVKIAFNEETLRDIGKTFVKGIIVIKTTEGTSKVSKELLDPTFKSFTGYTIGASQNEISERFNSSDISDITINARNVYEWEKSSTDGKDVLNIESFSKEGYYYLLDEKLNQ